MPHPEALRCLDQPPAFVPADTRRRAAVPDAAPRAHLDEHQRAVRLAHHEIQFAGAHGHVRSNQHEAAPLEE